MASLMMSDGAEIQEMFGYRPFSLQEHAQNGELEQIKPKLNIE